MFGQLLAIIDKLKLVYFSWAYSEYIYRLRRIKCKSTKRPKFNLKCHVKNSITELTANFAEASDYHATT